MKRDANQIVIVVLATLTVAAFGAIGADWWVRSQRAQVKPGAVTASTASQPAGSAAPQAASQPVPNTGTPPPAHQVGDLDQ